MAVAPTISLLVETSLARAQLRCMLAALKTKDPIERQIELSALRALREIQRMGEEARWTLGISTRFQLRIC